MKNIFMKSEASDCADFLLLLPAVNQMMVRYKGMFLSVLVQRSLSQREHRQWSERQQLTPHVGPHVELCGSHGYWYYSRTNPHANISTQQSNKYSTVVSARAKLLMIYLYFKNSSHSTSLQICVFLPKPKE